MDKVEQLYNLYLQKGIITSATTLEMFRAANADQQSALYNLGKQKDLFQTTDLSTFQTAWTGGGEPAPTVKKKSSQILRYHHRQVLLRSRLLHNLRNLLSRIISPELSVMY